MHALPCLEQLRMLWIPSCGALLGNWATPEHACQIKTLKLQYRCSLHYLICCEKLNCIGQNWTYLCCTTYILKSPSKERWYICDMSWWHRQALRHCWERNMKHETVRRPQFVGAVEQNQAMIRSYQVGLHHRLCIILGWIIMNSMHACSMQCTLAGENGLDLIGNVTLI